MLRPASQHQGCARLGDRAWSGGPAQSVRHEAAAVVPTWHSERGPQCQRLRLGTWARQHHADVACAGAALRAGVRAGHRRWSLIMACGEVGLVAAAGMVMIGCIRRRMAKVEVNVGAVVGVGVACSRGVMPGCERPVHHECQRRRQRQASREPSREQMDEASHRIPDAS